jgi:hypothetical protein
MIFPIARATNYYGMVSHYRKQFLYVFSRFTTILFRWNFVVGLFAGAPVQFLHLLVALINKWCFFVLEYQRLHL